MKKEWWKWAYEQAVETGRCPGNTPSFGLNTDLVTQVDFQSSASNLKHHDVKSCSCWKEHEVPAPATLVPGPIPHDLLGSTEHRVRVKVTELKSHLHRLVDRLSVDDFHLVVDGNHQRVAWKATIPPTLITLVNQLNDYLSPQK